MSEQIIKNLRDIVDNTNNNQETLNDIFSMEAVEPEAVCISFFEVIICPPVHGM